MEQFISFTIILIVFIGMSVYMHFKKRTGHEEPLWRLIIRSSAIIVLSAIFLANENLGPVSTTIAIVFISITTIFSTIQIIKKVIT